MNTIFGIVVLMLLLIGCGGSGNLNNQVAPEGAKVTVKLFSTPKCEACEVLIPTIDRGISQRLSAASSRISSVLYVVTSSNGFQTPTPETAATYKAKLNVSFETVADFWRTGNYATYYGKDSLRVPGVVLIKGNETPLVFDNAEYIDPELVLAKLRFLLGAN